MACFTLPSWHMAASKIVATGHCQRKPTCIKSLTRADSSRSFVQAVQRCSDKGFAGLSCAPCVITRSSSSCQIPSEPLGARQQPAPSTEFHATKAGQVLILYIQFTRPRPRPKLNPCDPKSAGAPVAPNTFGARSALPSGVGWEEPLDAMESGPIS